MKNISFLSDFFQFLVVKFSIYLNRRVFVMSNFRSGVIRCSISVNSVSAKREGQT